jgi:hypothetical protein
MKKFIVAFILLLCLLIPTIDSVFANMKDPKPTSVEVKSDNGSGTVYKL